MNTQKIEIDVKTLIANHVPKLNLTNVSHSPVRHVPKFPNGADIIPIKPFSHEYFLKNRVSISFPDHQKPLTISEALAKDSALSYTLYFEKNNGNNTFSKAVEVTSQKDWEQKIPWDKLTNDKDSKPQSGNDFSHKLTFNLIDHDKSVGEPNRVIKHTVRLSLINERGPDSNHNTGHPEDVKSNLTYSVGQVVTMAQLFKDANLTSNNISDSWFEVAELTHFFSNPALIEKSGVLKLEQKNTPSSDPTIPGSETRAIRMMSVGSQPLVLSQLKNPVGNSERLPGIIINVSDKQELDVKAWGAYTFNLGRDLNDQVTNFIREVKIGDQVIPKSEYDVIMTKVPPVISESKGIKRPMFISSQGQKVSLKVVYKGTIPVVDKVKEVSSEIKVNWGKTVGGNIGYSEFTLNSAAISILETQGKLELVPTFGEELTKTHSYMELRPNGQGQQTVVSLYGKNNTGTVDLAFERQAIGEFPVKSGNKIAVSGNSNTTIA